MSTFDAWEFDWAQVTKGTPVLFSRLLVGRRSVDKWPRRDDGLYEVCFLRLKKDGNPVFCLPSDKRQTCPGGWEFAFPDDAKQVASLLDFIEQRERKEQQSKQERERKQQQAKQERKERICRAIAERDSQLRRAAEEVGITFDEMQDACNKWDQMRNRTFRQNYCFMCGKRLRDPASIVSGIGPECIKVLPKLRAALRAKVLSIGNLRYSADTLIARFSRAGLTEIADLVKEASE